MKVKSAQKYSSGKNICVCDEIITERYFCDSNTGKIFKAKLKVPRLKQGATPCLSPTCRAYSSSSTTSGESTGGKSEAPPPAEHPPTEPCEEEEKPGQDNEPVMPAMAVSLFTVAKLVFEFINMPGRKKCLVAKLFRDTTSTGKTPQVQCLFCEEKVVKNGSRMTKHIAKCLKCDESVKLKYLTPAKNKDVQQESQACSAMDADDSNNLRHLPEQSRKEARKSPSGSRQTKVTSYLTTPVSESTLATSTSTKSKTPSFIASQENKINRYVDSMNENQIKQMQLDLARVMYATGCPLSMVENGYWVNFFKKWKPAFTLPSRDKVSNELLQHVYEEVETSVKEKVGCAKSVAVVCDGWSNIRNESIINFLVTTPERVFWWSSKNTGAESHTGEYLAEEIIKVIKEVGPRKVAAVCTDNAANMQKAWKIINSKYEHIQCYGCAAHTLNLIFSDVGKLKTAQKVMQECTSITKAIKRSHKLSALLRKDSVVSLKLPAKTRWGSYIHCVESTIKNKHALQALAINDEAKDVLDSSIKKTILSEVFWDQASGYVNLLKPVADGILKLEGDNICLSQVLQVMSDVSQAININAEASPFLKSEEESLKKIVLDRREFLVKQIHLAADLLDPKFNGCHLSGEERADAMELIHDLAEMDPELNTSAVLSELGEFNAKKKFFAKQFVWKAAEKTDPVTWWTGICSITELSKIAEAILSCPPTSAAAERSFSVHGNIHSAKRNKLTTRRAGKLVYISHNIQLLGDFNEAEQVVRSVKKLVMEEVLPPPETSEEMELKCEIPHTEEVYIKQEVDTEPVKHEVDTEPVKHEVDMESLQEIKVEEEEVTLGPELEQPEIFGVPLDVPDIVKQEPPEIMQEMDKVKDNCGVPEDNCGLPEDSCDPIETSDLHSRNASSKRKQNLEIEEVYIPCEDEETEIASFDEPNRPKKRKKSEVLILPKKVDRRPQESPRIDSDDGMEGLSLVDNNSNSKVVRNPLSKSGSRSKTALETSDESGAVPENSSSSKNSSKKSEEQVQLKRPNRKVFRECVCDLPNVVTDEYDEFASHIATTLRDINDPDVFRRVKIKVNEVLLEALAGNYSNSALEKQARISELEKRSNYLAVKERVLPVYMPSEKNSTNSAVEKKENHSVIQKKANRVSSVEPCNELLTAAMPPLLMNNQKTALLDSVNEVSVCPGNERSTLQLTGEIPKFNSAHVHAISSGIRSSSHDKQCKSLENTTNVSGTQGIIQNAVLVRDNNQTLSIVSASPTFNSAQIPTISSEVTKSNSAGLPSCSDKQYNVVENNVSVSGPPGIMQNVVLIRDNNGTLSVVSIPPTVNMTSPPIPPTVNKSNPPIPPVVNKSNPPIPPAVNMSPPANVSDIKVKEV